MINSMTQENIDEPKIRSIVLDEMQRNAHSGSPIIPRHDHDNNNSPRIHASDLIHNTKYMTWLEITPGSFANNIAVISGVQNPSSVVFHGLAYTPLSGTVTGKASISGNAQLGVVTQANVISSGTTTIVTIPNIIQTNSSSFFDGNTSLVDKNGVVFTNWHPTVDADNINLAAVYDNSDTLVANLQVTAFTNTSITVQAYVKANWFLEGSILIT